MARKLRIEYEGAMYHVINRGNYRADVFNTEGAKEAFEACLWEASEKAGWRVHAYVVMRNHYHLALETPRGNLVGGMQWLQATFANRFNRYRQENGHVFQGRYQALLVEDLLGLGALGHYIHLNPVRARILPIEKLADYRHGSYAYLTQPRKRPPALTFDAVLQAAGQLPDTPAGRARYRDYLIWLATDESAKKELAFATMSKGWALGSKAFKVGLIEDQKHEVAQRASGEADSREVRNLVWTAALQACLTRLGKTTDDVASDRKAAAWKVAIAAHLKQNSAATNPWLADALRMGAPEGVSRYVAELKLGGREPAAELKAKISNIMV
jgi:REP element-mobilizing transposase RayT